MSFEPAFHLGIHFMLSNLKCVDSSDVRYIDIEVFLHSTNLLKSILYLLMIDNYRTAEFSIIYRTIRVDINYRKV